MVTGVVWGSKNGIVAWVHAVHSVRDQHYGWSNIGVKQVELLA
jgi:hypothetical protein